MPKDRILILGAGFIGKRLKYGLNCQISDKDIRSFSQAEKEILSHKPSIIINCIGRTGKNVDYCEKDKDKSLLANTFIPVILAEVALRHNIRLVHISSGCIFHYDYAKGRPINEDKTPDFLELFYSRTKIYSEQALKALSLQYPVLIARIRIPLDDRPHPRNILTKLLSFKEVIDLPNSITYLPDFINALKHLIKIRASGIYNIVNNGALRYPELLDAYKKYVPEYTYKTVNTHKLGLVRTNLVLSAKKLSDSGFKVRDIHNVLDECVRKYLNEKR